MAQRRTWPSFTPMGPNGIQAIMALSRHCRMKNCWEEASHPWQIHCLQCGSAIKDPETEEYCLYLGGVQAVCGMTWPLLRVETGVPDRDLLFSRS